VVPMVLQAEIVGHDEAPTAIIAEKDLGSEALLRGYLEGGKDSGKKHTDRREVPELVSGRSYFISRTRRPLPNWSICVGGRVTGSFSGSA